MGGSRISAFPSALVVAFVLPALLGCGASERRSLDTGPADSGYDVAEAGAQPRDASIDSSLRRTDMDVVVAPNAGHAADARAQHPEIAAPDGGPCGDASACEPPASVCVDDIWLAYFTDSSCEGSSCRWEVQYQACPDGCQQGGCIYNSTL